MTHHPGRNAPRFIAIAIAAAWLPIPAALADPSPWVPCANDPSNICYDAGNVGVGAPFPGERLHLGDGNFLIEGGGETAIKLKRDITYTGGPSGTSQNPIFEVGRIIQAGDKDPEFRFLYTDDLLAAECPTTPARSVLEFDRKGIVASVKPERGSHFEGFLVTPCPDPAADPELNEPVFRLNSYPKMRLEMGEGGPSPVDVAIQREGPATLALLTNDTERVRIDANGNVGLGQPSAGARLDVAGDILATSSIRVEDGYVQLDTSKRAPPARDCNSRDEVGRMKADADLPYLYVCTASGWKRTKLNSLSSN